MAVRHANFKNCTICKWVANVGVIPIGVTPVDPTLAPYKHKNRAHWVYRYQSIPGEWVRHAVLCTQVRPVCVCVCIYNIIFNFLLHTSKYSIYLVCLLHGYPTKQP